MRFLLLNLMALFLLNPVEAQSRKVVVISIDGLRGVELTSLPDAHRNLPNLNEIVSEGAVSAGMQSVFPSVTYPNHTAMMTGDAPVDHGILGNFLFDPEHVLAPAEGWYEYSSLIRVPTLWDAAHDAGLKTASVYWPVTVGAAIDANAPEHYPVQTERDRLLYGALWTNGLLKEYEKANGPLPLGEAFNDKVRARIAAFLITTRTPDLTLVHFIELDHAEHLAGPDTPEAAKALEGIDSDVGLIREAIKAAKMEDRTDIVIVSDHGFFPVTKSLHPNAVLASMGLQGTKDHRDQWRVSAFGGGGSFGLVAHDPNDTAAIQTATAIFKRLEAEGNWGIERVLDGDALQATGGYSNCFLAVNMRTGFMGDDGDSGAWITGTPFKGMHGYLPGPDNMDASFAIFGPGITHQKLARGHVVDVAPTVAGLLGIPFQGKLGVNIYPGK